MMDFGIFLKACEFCNVVRGEKCFHMIFRIIAGISRASVSSYCICFGDCKCPMSSRDCSG